MAGHTPGPWTVRSPKTDSHAFDVFGPTGTKLHHGYWGGEADAHLIAAAPGLLEALKNLTRCIDSDDMDAAWDDALSDYVAAAEAVIAKAEGRA